jgi:dienelactone hydrolase
MRVLLARFLAMISVIGSGVAFGARPPEPPDRSEPGDAMVQAWLLAEAQRLDAGFLNGAKNADEWMRLRPRLKEQYLYMLGLSPLPDKTPLEATITRTLPRDGYVVDMIHYQSRPKLYVTGNLYRPASVKAGERLPAVLYVCGHSNRGRDGNKTAYQSHGIWFARHGYVCLTVDSLQLGEITGIHHGTYREGRWWWHSRGYTPAGVECWNGIRGIDYLLSRPDVDPDRIVVTGISGGGAATFWVAAADDRVKVAVAVSGMADLVSYIGSRTINHHCDCMFLYNVFEWPWTRIAALVAPRPLLFVNSDDDPIFPMDANERIINRLERLYSWFGAGDLVDAVVSVGGHAYRKDIRQAAFRFINMHIKGDPRIVTDSEVDLVGEGKDESRFPIPPAELRVFAEDSDLPKDQLNTTIDRFFVPMADVKPPADGQFDAWKHKLLAELRRVTFRHFPDRMPEPQRLESASPTKVRLAVEPGVEFRLQMPGEAATPKEAKRIVLVIRGVNEAADGADVPPWAAGLIQPGDAVSICDPRSVGETRWTRKNPPNYVERSHALLGRTVDTGRVWDVAAAARYLRRETGGQTSIYVCGKGAAGVIGAYAALLEPDIAGVMLVEPPLTHMDPAAPQFLNVLRVCDIPDTLGMLAPRPLRVIGATGDGLTKVSEAYAAAGAGGQFAQE